MNKKLKSLLIVLFFGILVGSFFYFDFWQYLSLKAIKENQQIFADYYAQNKYSTITVFFVFYLLFTALSLPGAAFLTLLSGALFGLVLGVIIISFASTLGATLSFLSSRYLLRDYVQQRFSKNLKPINEGIDKEGGFYLFSLRLVPAFPFFLINLIMGVTNIKLSTYYIVSQIGMLPGTIVFVNTGTQLSQLNSDKGILSPSMVCSFIALGLFPIIAKKALEIFKHEPS